MKTIATYKLHRLAEHGIGVEIDDDELSFSHDLSDTGSKYVLDLEPVIDQLRDAGWEDAEVNRLRQALLDEIFSHKLHRVMRLSKVL